MKKLIPLALLLTAPIALPVAAYAQEAAPVARIVIVDYQRVGSESDVAKDIQEQMQSFQVDMEARLSEIEDDLRQKAEDLQSQRAALSEDEFRSRARDLQMDERSAQQEMQELQQQGQRALQQANVEIQRSLRPIVKSIMEERKGNVVIDKAFVAQTAPGLDVTTEVIERLNAAISTFEVALPGRTLR